MAQYYYKDDDIENTYDIEYNQTNDHDECEKYTYDDDDDPCFNQHVVDAIDDIKSEIPRVEYNLLTIGITNLVVSNHGTIRKASDIFSSSMGYALPGTPYRTYVIEIEKNVFEEYFVHDLVWRAFHGEPPDDWEVRHTFWEPKKGNEFYDNSLEHLAIYPSTVVYLPSARKSLPAAY